MTYFQRFEGGQIGVTGDRAVAVEWYCRHLGLAVVFDSPAEGQTLLRFSGGNAIPLVSVSGGTRRCIWPSAGGMPTREPHMRLTLATPDAPGTRAALAAEGIRVDRLRKGPGGLETFDLWDLEGTRLTLVSAPNEMAGAGTTRVSGYAPPRIGVRDLEAALAWYSGTLGMTVLYVQAPFRRALLELGTFLPLWLEQLPPERFRGPQAAFARPFLLAPDIEAAHAYCRAQKLQVSPLLGEPGDLRLFQFFDPDGNAIGVWWYPGAGGAG
ncbi:MAG: hypothetical protein DCC58_06955 [Chloroflexi bacterium]|nr:MAG: hypothetical protein DCC58_06955 [Chloroflexota bacterium]